MKSELKNSITQLENTSQCNAIKRKLKPLRGRISQISLVNGHEKGQCSSCHMLNKISEDSILILQPLEICLVI